MAVAFHAAPEAVAAVEAEVLVIMVEEVGSVPAVVVAEALATVVDEVVPEEAVVDFADHPEVPPIGAEALEGVVEVAAEDALDLALDLEKLSSSLIVTLASMLREERKIF